ncbi:MAG: DUF6279 family lipoprotein [Usitatibacter sp.]
MRRLRIARWLLLAAAALLATACSLTRLAYDNVTVLYSNAAPMLSWMVDDYVDISGEQKEWVRERLGRAIAWHRSQELPAYRRFLETVAARFEGNFSHDEARDSYGEMRAHYRKAVEYVLPDVADFLLRLDDEQLAQLERRFSHDDRMLAREMTRGSDEERHRERMKRIFVHLEQWTGTLDDAQRGLVDACVRSFPDTSAERLADRSYRQAQTLALIRARPDKEQMVAGLRRLLVDADSWRPGAYQRKLRSREDKTFDMVASLSATLTPRQRAHLSSRLLGYVRDISTLTAAN